MDVTTVVDGYLECALWTASCNGMADHDDCRGEDCDTSLDEVEGLELSADAVRQATEDVTGFLETVTEDRPTVLDGMDVSMVGHDFYLTRCGHGAGFWDRGLGERGDYLTYWAKTFGSADFYVGDDGLIYC